MLVPERRHQRLLATLFSASPRCRGVGGVHNRREPATAIPLVGHVGDGLARIMAAPTETRRRIAPTSSAAISRLPRLSPPPPRRAVITVACLEEKGARDYGQHGPT